MRSRLRRIPACLALASAFAISSPAFAIEIHYGRCLTDDEVPAAERAPYQRAAMAVAEAMIRRDAEAMADTMTEEARASLTAEGLEALMGPKSQAPLSGLHVVHSFRLSLTQFGDGGISQFPCSLQARRRPSGPEGRAMVGVRPVPLQAHVLLEAESQDQVRSFAVWLIPNGERWEVTYVHVGVSAFGGMRTGEALKRARRERDAGRMLNAKLLYASAVFLSQSGPALILGVHQQAIEDMGNLPEVPPFEGPPPWQAHYGDRTFTISAIGVFYQDGKWLIGLAHNSTASDDRTAEADNRALISAFEAAHPEYAKAFDGVRAEARMLGDRSHTTIGLVRR